MTKVLELRGVNKTFPADGKELRVLNGIDLTIEEGEFVVIVGRSGCGKSTLLKIIAGLEKADAGSGVLYRGSPVTSPGPERSMIFQEHRLMPWLTVEKNVVIGISGKTAREKREIARRYLELVKLQDFRRAYPSELSGGMNQRVAVARALTTSPDILLLDEPFGALDALTKIEMQDDIQNIRLTHKSTMVMVTHDIEEAVYLADRVIVLSNRPGQIRDIVKIELPARRDRTGSDFAWFKKKIFTHFFTQEDRDAPEFVI